MIKLILFDMAGIMHNGLSTPYSEYLAKVSGKSIDDVVDVIKPVTSDLAVSRVTLAYTESKIASGLGIKRKDVRYLAFTRDNLRLYKLNVSFIRSLKKNYKIGSLTNNDEASFRYALSLLGKGFFDYPFSSSRLHCRKPDQKMYILAAKKAGLRYGEILFVDDTERNLLPARDLGMKTIVFDTLTGLKANLKKLGVKF